MALQTRKPTGLPSWPIVVLGGREKAGKSWAAISASASKLVGRTIYLGLGENDPDEYALIPGADFDIAEHEGTFPSFLQTVRDAVAEPRVGGKPTLLVIDSATRLWNLIGDNLQAIANKRANGRRTASGDYAISTDLWNVGAGWWQDVMDALRAHQGPVIITARLDEVAVMEGGAPAKSGAKQWKVQAHKSLVFDADAVIEMHERGHFLLTGVRSARIQLPKPRLVPDFTIEWLWDALGLSEGTADRSHATVRADGSTSPIARIQAAGTLADLQRVWMDLQREGLTKDPELIEAKDVRKAELQTPAQNAPAAVDAPSTPDPAVQASAGRVQPPAQGSGEESQEEYEARVAAEFDAIADAAAAEETKP
jgi:hypothetical protein